MEHLQHFDLRQDPFSIEPDLRVYFDSPSHSDAQRRVERGLRQGKGLTVLTGEGGTGKTLLARRVLNGLEEEVFEASLIVMLPGATEAAHVLQRFARQLGEEQPGEDRAALMVQLYDMLAAVREEGRQSVLILDDAHLLGSEQMAEICGLLNLEYEDRRLLSILLVGLPKLDDPLLPAAGLEQRVDVRVRLQPLDADNSSRYLEHRLETAGGRPDILTPEAITRLFELSGGRPRLMNTLADNGLFEAFLAKRAGIGATDIERAAADLGILPDRGANAAPPEPQPEPHTTGAPAEGVAVAGIDLEASQADVELGLSMSDAMPGLEDSVEDLGSLLNSPAAEEELSTLLAEGERSDAGATIDLDNEVEAVLREAGEPGPPPLVRAENASEAAMAQTTRVAFPEGGPPKDQSSDELDDLFVELIED